MTTNYTNPISVRVDDDTKEFYQKLADKDRRKLAEYIRILLVKLREEGSVSLNTHE